MLRIFLLIGGLALLTPLDLRAQIVEVALCEVDNPGNAPDPATGFGKVDHAYRIGKYDITIAQYVEFLNAVAQNDKYRLYHPKMAKSGNFKDPSQSEEDFHTSAGITRSGEAGSYVYSVVDTSGNQPVVWVTWLDAARFCNWLQNGQPKNIGEAAGSTETGAYILNGDRTRGNEVKNPDAKWWIPTEDEWYKAAFYDPRLNNGAGGYWRYPTQSNSAPGNEIGGGSNEANYIVNASQSVRIKPGDSYTSLMTPVGAFPNAVSYYGTCDQAGNVGQWNDALVASASRGLRGGGWNGFADALASSAQGYVKPSIEDGYTSFRVATLPQELVK